MGKNRRSPQRGQAKPQAKGYLFDRPGSVRKLLRSFYGALAFLLVLDFLVHKHALFPWEEWPEFYATYGFVACVVLVVVAKYVLRPVVMKREDYYDR